MSGRVSKDRLKELSQWIKQYYKVVLYIVLVNTLKLYRLVTLVLTPLVSFIYLIISYFAIFNLNKICFPTFNILILIAVPEAKHFNDSIVL